MVRPCPRDTSSVLLYGRNVCISLHCSPTWTNSLLRSPYSSPNQGKTFFALGTAFFLYSLYSNLPSRNFLRSSGHVWRCSTVAIISRTFLATTPTDSG